MQYSIHTPQTIAAQATESKRTGDPNAVSASGWAGDTATAEMFLGPRIDRCDASREEDIEAGCVRGDVGAYSYIDAQTHI